MTREELMKAISDNVVEMEDEEVESLCKEGIEMGIEANDIITEGLIDGMNRVSELYEEGEYYLPEVLTASYAMNVGIDYLKEFIKRDDSHVLGKMVIGVVQGDTHDIGKNLVKIMCEAAGFEVFDLGRDVPLDEFIRVAEEKQVDFICMSTLMTTTMGGMKVVIDKLKEAGIRDKYKVMIGGGPISQKFADEIGADIYSVDANDAVRKAKGALGIA